MFDHTQHLDLAAAAGEDDVGIEALQAVGRLALPLPVDRGSNFDRGSNAVDRWSNVRGVLA